jgi:hypothetical protein
MSGGKAAYARRNEMKPRERREIARMVMNAPSYEAEQDVVKRARLVDIRRTIPARTYQLVPDRSNWDSADIKDFLVVARKAGAVWDSRGRECLISEDQIPVVVIQLLDAGFLPVFEFPGLANDDVWSETLKALDVFAKRNEEPAVVSGKR